MDNINSAIGSVMAVGPVVWKYVRYQIYHSHYMSEFKEMQGKLKRRLSDVDANLKTQQSQTGKIPNQEVVAWLEKARQETAEEVIEDLIYRGGCFTYICSSRRLDKKTQALNKGIYLQGERYTNAGLSLVVDDHSIEYCALAFKEKREKLKHQKESIEAILKTQRMQPGKIAKKEVEEWLEKASQQIPIKVEDLINQGECSSSSNLEKKTKELKQTFEQGEKYTNVGVSLVVDDHSIEYCALVFKQRQERLKHQKESIEAILKTQCMQPRKIARKEVEEWLEKANQQIAIKAEDLINQGECSLSPNLEKKTRELKQIFEQGEKYTNASESLVVDDHSIKGLPLPIEKCSGRDDIQDQILEWLKGDKITRIAIWGMGGVGKTTIMKQVHNQLLKEPKFNKVIWVKVSKDFNIIVQQKKMFDILKFQKRIASSLELKLRPEDYENEIDLAKLILQKLRQGSYALILDDVWEPFALEDVGIPDLDGNNGCKLVLTTRSHNVARDMDCKVIPVNPLPPNEALALFLEKVGSVLLLDGIIKKDIEPFLKKILQKCDGVPLAIVTLAKTMRGKLDPRSWKWALSKLSKFEGIVDRLKFSYECLESQCQECFLYCALYPEDYEIPREELIECWIEEGFIYKEGETRDIMNCEGHVMLEKLVDNCLLESVKNRYEEDCVSMHDLFREMALDIRPQFLVKAGMGLEKLPEEHEWRKDLFKVSLMRNYIAEIPSSMSSPKCTMLATLLLSNNMISTIPEAFFEHMLGLKILDLSNNPKLGRLPSSVSKLEKLTTLLLGGCSSLREVQSLSKLGSLKKFVLWGTLIEELPQGLNMLANLKYLSLGGEELSKVPDGLLQNLSKLQHLDVDDHIPLKGEEIRRLGKLECLYGLFSTAHDISIFFNARGKSLNMYSLFLGSFNIRFCSRRKLKTIVCCDVDICGQSNWLPSDVPELIIINCKDVRSLNEISGFQDATDLQFLTIGDCDGMDMECSLSWPWLNSLQNLEEVGKVAKSAPLPTGIFSSLKEITVISCNKIKKLFSTKWLGYLQSLKAIVVRWCNQMEEIIWSEYEGQKAIEKVILPKLESLKLANLPQLKSIYRGSSTVLICDSIKKIEIQFCSKIESVFGSGFKPLLTLENLELWELQNLKSVFDEEALGLSPALPPTIFFSLQTIRVFYCDQLKKVFSSGWLLGYFQFLETIEVGWCLQMEELISSSAYEEEKVTLPKLESLKLTKLPQLKGIYSCSSTVLIYESIKSIQIERCPKIQSIFSSRFNPLPTLENLELWQLENLKLVFDEEALGLSPSLPPTIFFSLKTIKVHHCDQLKKVFSSGWLLGYFQFLETIEVRWCSQMEELISSSTYEEEKVTLPNLQRLVLKGLLALKSIYSNSSVLICNCIEKLEIVDCEKLKRIPLNFGLLDNAQSSHSPALKQIVVFPKECWESLEWDHPNAKDILLPLCKFEDDNLW